VSDDPYAEAAALRRRLDEVEAALDAVRSGEADGLVAPSGVVSLMGAERPYQVFFESMHEGGLTLDRAGRVLNCNPRFAAMLESSVAGLRGTLFTDHVAPGNRARVDDLMARGKHAVAAVSLTARTGVHVPTLVSLAPIDSVGHYLMCVVVTDLRAQKAAAVEALLDSEAFSRGILDSYPAEIAVLDRHGTIIAVNKPWREFAIENSNIPGKAAHGTGVGSNYLAQCPPDVAEGIRSVLAAGAERYALEYPCHSPSQQRWRAMDTVALGGGTRAVLISHIDITERVLMEHQLRQAQKMEAIGQLTGGMAHDFNNILAVVIGNLEELRLLGSLDPEEQEMLGEALAAAGRAAELTRRLLAFARQQPLEPKQTEPNGLLTELTKLMRRTLGENLVIELALAGDAWPIWIDPAQLESAVLNIATNARDAMPNGGRLTIATTNRHLDAEEAGRLGQVTPGDYLMITITDTGTGIPPELMGRIFEPFFTTKERGQGTGLGLAMVFGFVKQSGGHIDVSSELGRGSTFSIQLPRASTARRDAVSANTTTKPGRGETVLVVEDNDELRRLALRRIASLGYRVQEASTADAALAILEKEPIALVFSDVVMPGGTDGELLARQVVQRWPGTKVVLTSGFTDRRFASNDKPPLPPVPLLTKPYTKEMLSRVLFDALNSPGTAI
jgi:signal transduction histidine kinase